MLDFAVTAEGLRVYHRPMRLLVGTVAAAASLACAASLPPDDPRRLVGQVLPHLPLTDWKGWRFGTSRVVGYPDLSWGCSEWSKGQDGALLFSKVGSGGGLARQDTVVDVVVVGLAPGTLLATECQIQSTSSDPVVAQVEATEEPWHTVVRRAWKLDRAKGKIVEIPVNGVRCVNDDIGD